MFSVKRSNCFRSFFVHSLVIVVTGFYATSALAEENYVVAGSAYNLDTNDLVYRELYTAIDENKAVRVDYVTPDGSTFASKTLLYEGEPFQPSFNFEDTRDNQFVGARFEGARLILTEGMDGAKNEKVIHDNARTVIDAGFDAYIQLNWDRLVAGKHLKFDFAMPNRLSSILLEVRQIKGPESPVYEASFGGEWIYFRIAPAKKFISLFADPIHLAYDPNGKYLMRFHGRSNIDDDRGGPQDVRIEYEYTN